MTTFLAGICLVKIWPSTRGLGLPHLGRQARPLYDIDGQAFARRV
jgi:hypothetical protein